MFDAAKKNPNRWLLCALLALVTAAVYAPVFQNNFINLDDPDYVMNNVHVRQGLTADTVRWAFGTLQTCNWHPLTWLSHALDYELFGLNPMGHHLVNVAWHVLDVVLLFMLLANLTGRRWPSAWVALLFGIHPMHVESVAWVSERKDLLSGFFFLLTLLAYARYAQSVTSDKGQVTSDKPPSNCHPPSSIFYLLALFCFALGLMSKPMLVTLPCILLLLDYWPLGRISGFKFQVSSFKLLLEKIPFFAVAAISCWVTFVAQAGSHAVVPVDAFPPAARLAHVPVAYGWYVSELFWPTKLSFYYLIRVAQPMGQVVGGCALLLLVTAVAVWRARTQPWLLVGWLWFLGMLVPVLGVMQVGDQAYADRYSYLPYVGLFIMLAWSVPALLAKWKFRQPVLWGGTILISIGCIILTLGQIRLWNNSITLYQRAIALDEDNVEAWDLIGLQYVNLGDLNQAVTCLREATRRDPMFQQAWTSLGRVLVMKEDYAGAVNAFQKALPYAEDQAMVQHFIGDAFMKGGQYVEAAASLQTSLELTPEQPEVYVQLGQCLALIRQPARAAAAFQNAIRLQPDNADAELGLATLLNDGGQMAEAISHYRRVLHLQADSVVALNNLAWLLATAADPALRNGGEAVRLAEQACKQTQYNQPFFIGTLAAAYAETGRFDEAVKTAQKACAVALAQGKKEVAANNERLLEKYQTGQAFHEAARTAP